MTDSKIKILMVGLLPTDIKKVDGGVVAVMLNLLSGFSKRPNVEITMVSFNQEIDQEDSITYAPNIRIHFIPYVIKYKIIDYFINRKKLRRIINVVKPDILHIQEVTPHILRFIHLPKNFIVATQHGIMSEEIKYAVGLRDKLQSLFKGYVERWVFPYFKNIIFISDYNKKLFAGKNFFDQKIYNPVNPIFFERPSRAEKLNSLIYVGRLNKNKNLSLVLQALGELKKENIFFELHVVGGYKDDYYEGLVTSLMTEHGLESQVNFYGWQTQEQILDIYKKGSVFILPSQQETLPVAIAEAMAQGKVVIASNVGAVSEMFTDTVSGFLFDRNDLYQLKQVLKKINNNSNLIESVSSKAIAEAREKFHPDSITSQTVEFYKKVLARGGNQHENFATF